MTKEELDLLVDWAGQSEDRLNSLRSGFGLTTPAPTYSDLKDVVQVISRVVYDLGEVLRVIRKAAK